MTKTGTFDDLVKEKPEMNSAYISHLYADVILPLAVPGKFTYRIPDFLHKQLSVGQLIKKYTT